MKDYGALGLESVFIAGGRLGVFDQALARNPLLHRNLAQDAIGLP